MTHFLGGKGGVGRSGGKGTLQPYLPYLAVLPSSEREHVMGRAASVAIAIVAGVTLAVFAQGVRRDGKWEVTMQMEMPGMPMAMPATSTTQCITPADANDPQKAMPPQGRGRGDNPNNCQVSDYKTEGNKVSWSMNCQGQQPMTGTGEFVYTADAYTGTIKMDMSGRGTMNMKYTGKRVGDCPSK